MIRIRSSKTMRADVVFDNLWSARERLATVSMPAANLPNRWRNSDSKSQAWPQRFIRQLKIDNLRATFSETTHGRVRAGLALSRFILEAEAERKTGHCKIG